MEPGRLNWITSIICGIVGDVLEVHHRSSLFTQDAEHGESDICGWDGERLCRPCPLIFGLST